jgi:hypothetical protein
MMSAGWLWALGGALVLILIFEFVALARRRLTISQMVWRFSARQPWFPFAVGVLCGHFFA